MAVESAGELDALARPRGGPWVQAARRLTRKKVAFGALIIIVIIYGAGALATWVAPQSFRETPAADLELSLPNFPHLTFSPYWKEDGTIYNSTSVGIFRSPNQGQSWMPINNGLGNANVELLAVAPSGSGQTTLFAGTSRGVFRSEDNGDSWVEASSGLVNASVNDIAVSPDFERDRTVFVALSGGVFVSSNAGESWQPMNDGFQSDAPNVFSLAISPTFATDGTIFAAGTERKRGSFQTSEEILRSRDRGQSWELVYEDTIVSPKVIPLAISPGYATDGTLYASVDVGLLRFTEGGDIWRNLDRSLGYREVQEIIMSPAFTTDNTVYAVRTTRGMSRSVDGGESFELINKGLSVTRLVGTAISPDFASDGTLLAGTVDAALFRSDDRGNSWYQVASRDLKKGPSILQWPPNLDNIFGTDRLGRDYFSRIIYGVRTTVIITLASVLTGSLLIGLFMGATSGFFGGKIDNAIMRVGEIFLAFPGILLIILIAATVKPRFTDWTRDFEEWSGISGIVSSGAVDYFVVFASLTMFSWVGMARLVRGQILHLKESQFVDAARSMGASNTRIIVRHLLPNAMSPVIVAVSMGMGAVAGAEVILSWFGIGVQPPNPSLGRMIFENFGYGNLSILRNDPHLILIPVFTLAIIIYAWNLLGDGLNDVLNPRTR